MGDLRPKPELWAALGQGALLTEILTDFYNRAFEDPQLAPFFEGTTKPWIVQKQYSFLRSKFTGENIFFGHRPRNAHHWMVISNELFDHRAAMMEDCMRRAGLAEHFIAQWMEVEEVFRKQIVKAQPIPRKLSGVALPLDGYGSIEVAVGSLCDGCTGAIDAGATAHYHLRTGVMYCQQCMPEPAQGVEV